MRIKTCCPLFLLFLLFTASGLSAQNQIADVTLIDLKYGAQQTMRNVYPGNNGYNYVLMSKKGAVSTAWSKERVILKKLGPDLNFMNDIPLDFAKYDPENERNGIWLVHDAAFNNYAVWNEYTEDAVTFFSCPIEDVTAVTEIATVKIFSKSKVQSVGVSNSKAYNAFAIDIVEADDELNRTHIISLDGNLKKRWIHSIEFNGTIDREGYAINESGGCLHMFRSNDKKDKKDPDQTILQYTCINPAGQSKQTIRKFGDYNVSPLVVAAGNTLSAVGLRWKHVEGKTNKDDKTVYSNLRIDFNAETGELISEKEERIPGTAITELIDNKGTSLKLQHARSLEDGSIIALGIVNSVHGGRWVTYYNPPVSGAYPETSYRAPSAYFSGVVAYHIKPDGVVSSLKTFESNFSINDFWLMEINPQVIDEKVYFTFMAKGLDIQLVRLNISEDKMQSAIQPFDRDVANGRGIKAETCSTTKDGSLIAVLDHPMKQARVAHFDMKE
jgi:hypothetical protein